MLWEKRSVAVLKGIDLGGQSSHARAGWATVAARALCKAAPSSARMRSARRRELTHVLRALVEVSQSSRGALVELF